MKKEKINKITIHTVDGYGNGWIYKCIDFGLVIAKRNSQVLENTKIEIILYKSKRVITPNLLIAKLLDKLICWKAKNKYTDYVPQDGESLLQGVKINNNSISLEKYKITIQVTSILLKNNIFQLFYCYLISAGYWLKILKKTPEEILNINYKEIRIGDVAAAETLRFFEGHAGKLKKSNAAFNSLYESILKVEKYSKLNFTGGYIMTPDVTYSAELLSRTGVLLGGELVRSDPDYGDYLIISGGGSELIDIENTTKIEDKKIEEYLQNRVKNSSKCLYYMREYNPLETDKIQTITGEKVMSCDGLTVIIFPHLVSDANYWRGIDGYSDLVHWLTTTIDILNDNDNVANILVKFHPNIGDFIGDYLYEERVIRKYRKENKIKFIDRFTSNLALKQINKIVAITHHGSVSEELTFLKIPNIRWASSIGADKYHFSQCEWSGRAEYERALREVNSIRNVDEEDLKMLRLYVKNERLTKIDYVMRKSEMKFKYYVTQVISRSDKIQIDERISNHEFNSEVIINYHQWLLSDFGLSNYYDDTVSIRK
jgi:hypothetical protein